MADITEWIEKIPKEWLPEWFLKVEEEEPFPFLGEWGSPKANKGEWVNVDTSLPLERKIVYRFIYDVEGMGVFYKNPEDLADEIAKELKKEYGLLGDTFKVYHWKYDADARTFEVHIERIPPFITTPPETAEPAAVGAIIITGLLVAGLITTVVVGYLALKLTLRNAQKFKEIVVEPVVKVIDLLKEMKPFLYIVAAGFLAAMGSYIFAQVAKAKKKA